MLRPHRAPIDELVLTVLSQNTNDRNRDVAYARLRERFSSWDEVREAPVEEVEEAIRPGGLAPTKSVRIQQILEAIGDDDLAWLADAPLDEARESCASCPAWGARPRPACCCSPSAALTSPVDTHVYRVGARLGLWPQRAPLDVAHDELARLCGADGEFAYETHVLLIRHGRRTCVARAPRCAECPLRRMCPEGRRRLARA